MNDSGGIGVPEFNAAARLQRRTQARGGFATRGFAVTGGFAFHDRSPVYRLSVCPRVRRVRPVTRPTPSLTNIRQQCHEPSLLDGPRHGVLAGGSAAALPTPENLGLSIDEFAEQFEILVVDEHRPRTLAVLQFLLVGGYTVGLTFLAPGLWFDPFGGLLKNLPILAAIAAWAALEEER